MMHWDNGGEAAGAEWESTQEREQGSVYMQSIYNQTNYNPLVK